ncbi:MAG: acyltransferase, partial [Candidatus Nanopelagicales bacterium]
LPVFAFATGLLMPRSVDRDGRGAYLRRRLATLAWIYLLWTLIEGTAEVLTSSVKNVPVTWGDVFAVWRPLGHLWFLPLLAIATIVVVAVAPWRPGRVRAAALVAVSVLSLSAWGWGLDNVFARGLALIVFFLVGSAITGARLAAATSRLPSWTVGVAGAAGLAVWVGTASVPWVTTPTIVDDSRTFASVALGMLGSFAALVGVWGVSLLLARTRRAGGWLSYIGRLSLQVYLAHILFTAATRIVLVRLGVLDAGVHLALGVVAGVVGPLLLERVTRPVPWLFAAPWDRR